LLLLLLLLNGSADEVRLAAWRRQSSPQLGVASRGAVCRGVSFVGVLSTLVRPIMRVSTAVSATESRGLYVFAV